MQRNVQKNEDVSLVMVMYLFTSTLNNVFVVIGKDVESNSC